MTSSKYKRVGNFILNHLDLNIHATINYIENYTRWHSTSKILFFIIYLLEDEQELSLGMLDTSPTYL